MSENIQSFESFFSGPQNGPQVKLFLHRRVPEAPTRSLEQRPMPVLLLHNASCGHQVFTIPKPLDGKSRSLIDWLAANGFDPWMLDWRGGCNTLGDTHNEQILGDHGQAYNFNEAAMYDIPNAVREMRGILGYEDPIGIVGICMGGATLAEAVARDALEDLGVSHIVLMTIGLFFVVPYDSRLKGDVRTLEYMATSTGPEQNRGRVVDPRVETVSDEGKADMRSPWHGELEQLYKLWPNRFQPHSQEEINKAASETRCVLEMCNRLSFIYGTPYDEKKLVEEVHNHTGDSAQRAELPSQFGAMPLHMLIHGAQNVRRGCAADYGSTVPAENAPLLSEDARKKFEKMERVTLITGGKNRVWHRESIDLMYEWLCRAPPNHWRKFRKIVLPDYGHLDLLWGKDAVNEVFPEIKRGLGK